MLEKKVDISPPTASLVDLNDSMTDDTEISSFLQGEMVQVAFDMEIGDLVDSQIMQLFRLSLRATCIANLLVNLNLKLKSRSHR